MTTRWWAFGLWALVAASAVFWALKLVKPAPPTPPQATVVAATSGLQGDLARVLGADAPDEVDAPEQAPESSRFALVGVVASKFSAGTGVALISVDGQPAKAFRVGAAVDGDTVLQAVRQREATLGPRGGDARFTLDIPPPPPAATGTLPAPGAAAPGLRPPGSFGGRALPLQPALVERPPAPQVEPDDAGVAGDGELHTE